MSERKAIAELNQEAMRLLNEWNKETLSEDEAELVQDLTKFFENRKQKMFTLQQVEEIARESVENSHHRIAEAPAFNDEWFAKKAKEIGG